jgi:3-isopropylmalate dehydrogenase
MTKIAVLPGDGIGPEVTAAGRRVLATLRPDLEFNEAIVGACAFHERGEPLPADTLKTCEDADAILFGAVGGPGFDHLEPPKRPEAAILGLRKHFGLFANLRPARVFPGMESRSPLRSELVDGMDLVFVRELTGGLYFGEKSLTVEDGHEVVRDVLVYRDFEIERAARFAFALARTRPRKKLTNVDKNNVLLSSVVWRRIVIEVAKDFPDVTLEHLIVDNAAMQIVRDPRAFDVILTENMFGDILSDEAAMVTGTIGTAASAALSGSPDGNGFGLYEPISGTAPDIAGKQLANPIGAILSAAMLARYSLGDARTADAIERAVAATLANGPRTRDLDPLTGVNTSAVTDAIVAQLKAPIPVSS